MNNNNDVIIAEQQQQQLDHHQQQQPQQHTDDVNNENKLHVQFHKFTDRFKTFSNEIIRTIELAHDVADLHNSKFAHATVAAAAAAATHELNKEISTPTSEEPIVNSTPPATVTAVVTQNQREENELLNNELNYDKLINNTNNLKLIIDKTKRLSTSSVSYLDNVEQPTSTTTSTINKQLNINDQANCNNSVYLSTLSLTNDASQTQNQQQNHVQIKSNIKRTDSHTTIPDGIYISIWEVFIYLWGCIAFFIDIVSDIILSIGYYNSNKKWLCALTLLFVIVPNVTLSLFSLSWYIDNYYQLKKKKNQNNNNNIDETDIGNVNSNRLSSQSQQKSNLDDSFEFNYQTNNNSEKKSTFDSITFWIVTIIFLALQLDLVYKYIQGFVYTLKGWVYRRFYKNDKWSKYYIEKQLKCDTDIGMLRLIDVFMDSGPQVLLQLYVITTQKLNDNNLIINGVSQHNDSSNNVFSLVDFFNQENRLVLKQVISITSSLFSMGYALAGYHRCLRNQQFIFCINKSKRLIKPISWFSTIMQFLWYLFLISPRVLSMALFASTFRSWFFMIIFIHWLIMYFWILNLKTNYCITSSSVYNAREEIFEKFYNFVCSFIYIFVYFNLKSGKTRYRYLVYYIIFYSENILFSISYYCFSNENNTFKLFMLCTILIGFWLAILFQIVYYLYCHPSQDIRLCVKKQDTLHLIHVSNLRNKYKNHHTSNGDVIRRYSKVTLDHSGSFEFYKSSNNEINNYIQPVSKNDYLKVYSSSEKRRNKISGDKQQKNYLIVPSNNINLTSSKKSEGPIPKIVINDTHDSKLCEEAKNKQEDDEEENSKFEYKLFHLNDNITSSQTTDDTDTETIRSFKSVVLNDSLNASLASIVSVESSTYHSIDRRPSSSYGSCLTLNDDHPTLNQHSHNPLFLNYDLNTFPATDDANKIQSYNAEILSLKHQIELLQTKETSL